MGSQHGAIRTARTSGLCPARQVYFVAGEQGGTMKFILEAIAGVIAAVFVIPTLVLAIIKYLDWLNNKWKVL